jgi:hypothetical protein
MTESELERLILDRLRQAGVVNLLDRDFSQFLWVGAEFFAEIVLTDASKQTDAERVLKEVATELKREETTLDFVVRSTWQVIDVQYLDVARTAEGGLRTALDFRAKLRSGARQIEVRVDVTIAALDVLRQKLGKDDMIMHIGWSPEKGDVEETNIAAAVKAYLEQLLSQGGTSYWDPLLDKHLDLHESAMSYVLGHSTAFRELHAAITDAFSPAVRHSFLKSLAVSGVRLADFDRALPELSNLLGGAYRRGQQFSVSASELFNSLSRGEQELIKSYFLIQSRKLQADHPEVLKEFRGLLAQH